MSSEGDIGSEATAMKSPNPGFLSTAGQAPRDLDEMRVENSVAAALFGAPSVPIRVGRFVVLSELGRGGMGVVYSGYDEQLDRKVAIKLLQFGRGVPGAERERLLREAQAMAKLSHPNVVQVYEVGEHDGQLFVAMEFVAGGDLRKWLEAGPHSWREVIRVLADAGRGLAAAHAVGLIHRDFKPENALMDPDGRARITDFGLTRRAGPDEAPTVETIESASELDSARLTRTGAIVGTPAYMAPEQWAAGVLDERTDQFAFCVTLFEALYGKRPFRGGSLTELRATVRKGECVAVEERGVPDRLRRAVRRGLARDPADRYPSMLALIHALTHDPWRARGRVALAGSAIVALSVSGWQAVAGDTEDHCAHVADAVQSAWNTSIRGSVEQRFDASTRSYSPQARHEVLARLDRFGADWKAMRSQACEATWVDRTQSESALDLRMACLDRRLEIVAALAQRFAQADDAIVDGALDAVQGLPTLAACADVDALRAAHPPPPPAIAAEVQALQSRLAATGADMLIGHVGQALEDIQPIAGEAERLEYPPLLAESLLLRGQLELIDNRGVAAEATLRAALLVAASAADPQIEADVWIELLTVVSTQDADHARGVHWALAAQVAATKIADPASTRARLDTTLAVFYLRAHDLGQAQAAVDRALQYYDGREEARAVYAAALSIESAILEQGGRLLEARSISERAIEILAATFGPEHPQTLDATFNLGGIVGRLGEFSAWARIIEGVYEARQRVYGADSPVLVSTLVALANAEQGLGHPERAHELLQRALVLAQEHYPPVDPRLGEVLTAMGNLLRERGEAQEALPYFERAFTILHATRGERHPHAAQSLANLGLLMLDLGNAAQARPRLEKAIAILSELSPDDPDVNRFRMALAATLQMDRDLEGAERHARDATENLERLHGETDPILPYGLNILGDILVDAGKLEDAEAAYRRAAELLERALGADAAPVGLPLMGLGGLLVDSGRLEEARVVLDRAIPLVADGGVGAVVICNGSFAVARMLRMEGAREAALTKGLEALECLPEGHANRAAIEAWLADPTVARPRR